MLNAMRRILLCVRQANDTAFALSAEGSSLGAL